MEENSVSAGAAWFGRTFAGMCYIFVSSLLVSNLSRQRESDPGASFGTNLLEQI